MKKFLIVLLLSGFCKILPAQLTYQNLFVDYDSAWNYQNLTIIPVRPNSNGGGNAVSLSQALQNGWAAITERGTASTENVHWLRINNYTNKPIFIQGGEIIMGGRQDRMVTSDTLMEPNGRDQYFKVMCVEEDRWSDKVQQFEHIGFAGPGLRKLLDSSGNQVLIWRAIYDQVVKEGVKTPTLAYADRRLDKNYQLKEAEYVEFFMQHFKQQDSTVTGMICLSGNRIIGCDIYAGNNLFYSALPSLLHGYIDEAVTNGAPVTVKQEAVKKYMDKILSDEESQEDFLKKNGKIYRYRKKVYHLTGYGE